MSLLEHIVKQIRENEPRKPGETIDAYMKRSWQMALAEYESTKPVLPRVKALPERSERLLERDRQISKQLVTKEDN